MYAAMEKGRGMAYRTFTDANGQEWNVWDVLPSRESEPGSRSSTYLPAEMAEGWLCFEAGEQKRRLTPLPVGWEDADDNAIADLLHASVPARPRGTRAVAAVA